MTQAYDVVRHPVRTLRVEVTSGPDAGKRFVAEDETVTIGGAEGNALVLQDPTVSRFHLELVSREEGVLVTDQGSTNGTFAGGIQIRQAIVPAGTELKLGATTVRVEEGPRGTVELAGGENPAGLVGETPAMRRLAARVRRASASDVPVLVIGESGTGKEVIARALHDEGTRAGKPFVTLDCAGLPATLIASELFGHEKGAFTGADRQHKGAFEQAEGGTIFLDEIGEMPPQLQATLLGVLERRRFRRVGGRDEVAVDVRVVTATNRDLRTAVNAGEFRLDLYYRLAVVTLHVPPLRERAEDVPLLVEHFLREAGLTGPVERFVSAEAMERLRRHYWPGNVRELRNFVEATIAMGEEPRIDGGTPEGGRAPTDAIGVRLDQPYHDARQGLLEEFERRYLARLIGESGGNVSKAAREAKLDRTYLIKLLQRHGLKK